MEALFLYFHRLCQERQYLWRPFYSVTMEGAVIFIKESTEFLRTLVGRRVDVICPENNKNRRSCSFLAWAGYCVYCAVGFICIP